MDNRLKEFEKGNIVYYDDENYEFKALTQK